MSAEHLKRYLGKFDFRYNERTALGAEDVERATKAVKGIVGKRLTYKNLVADKQTALRSKLKAQAFRKARVRVEPGIIRDQQQILLPLWEPSLK